MASKLFFSVLYIQLGIKLVLEDSLPVVLQFFQTVVNVFHSPMVFRFLRSSVKLILVPVPNKLK